MITMSYVLLFCLTMALGLQASFSYKCQQCTLDSDHCSKECKNGVIGTKILCCNICRRNIGEVCGGKRDICGVCLGNLTCITPSGKSTGICQPRDKSKGIQDYTISGDRLKRSVINDVVCFESSRRKRLIGEKWIRNCEIFECMPTGNITQKVIDCSSFDCNNKGAYRCCAKCQLKSYLKCNKNQMIIAIPKDQVEITGSIEFTFADKRCRAVANKTHLVLRANFSECGMQRVFSGKEIQFRNKVLSWNIPSKAVYRLRRRVSCSFANVVKIYSPGIHVFMNRDGIAMFYTTRKGRVLPFRKILKVYSGDDVFITIVQSNKNKMPGKGIYIETCSFLPSVHGKEKNEIEYTLIKNGCRVDESLKVLKVWSRGVWFSVRAAKLFGANGNPMTLKCTAIPCNETKDLAVKDHCQKQCLLNDS